MSATVPGLRKAIIDCAAKATAAEPTNTDARLHSFLARMSATMECLGERELDAVLWNLMSTTTDRPTPDEQAGTGHGASLAMGA